MEPTDFQIGDAVASVGSVYRGLLGHVDAIDVNFVYVDLGSIGIVRFYPFELEIV